MSRNTSVTLGKHYSKFVDDRIKTGRFQSTSEAIRAGLTLLEEQETKLDILKNTLAVGEAELDKGLGVDGQAFMEELIR